MWRRTPSPSAGAPAASAADSTFGGIYAPPPGPPPPQYSLMPQQQQPLPPQGELAPPPPPPAQAPSIESATLRTKVQLRISCANLVNRDYLSKSDPQAYIYYQHVGASTHMRLRRSESVSSIRSDASSVELRLGADGSHEVAGGWAFAVRTEPVKNDLNPVFPEIITFEYYFEEVQNLCVVIVDRDNNSGVMTEQHYLGHVNVSLGQVVSAGSRGYNSLLSTDCRLPRGIPSFHNENHQARVLRSEGQPSRITILASTEADNRRQLVFSFSCTGLPRKDANGLADPYFILTRIDRAGNAMHVYRSSMQRRTLEPVWRDLRVPLRLLAPDGVGSGDRLRISLWDWDLTGGDDYMASADTTVGGLLASAATRATLPLIDASRTRGVKKLFYRGSGVLRVDACAIVDEPQFLDFVAAGAQIDLAVAIDLTASNQYPHHPTSLHHFPELLGLRGPTLGLPANQASAATAGPMNEYQRAIIGVGQILQEYDTDKIFPMYGFGYEKPRGVRHRCGFFGRAFGVQGLLELYHDCVCDPLLSLSGPT
ncbi:Copine-4, partial [Cladochytrium tenue]